jgi:hypothetical protein
MFKHVITITLVLVTAAITFSVAGCSAGDPNKEYIDFAETAVEEYLVATNNKDFGTFSKDLGKEMEEALPEAEFMKFADQIEGIIGKYVAGSKEFVKVEKQSGYINVIYNTEYTDEPAGVIFTLTLQKVDGVIKIAGSWFNSPKIRGE